MFVILKAGINSDQLMLVTKAEAALMYCHHLPAQDHYQKLQDGIEYIVVLLGGTERLNRKFSYDDEF